MGFIEFRDRVAGFFDFSWGDSDGVLASFHQVREAIDAALDDHELDLPEEQAEQLNHQLNQYFDDIEHTGCSILVS